MSAKVSFGAEFKRRNVVRAGLLQIGAPRSCGGGAARSQRTPGGGHE